MTSANARGSLKLFAFFFKTYIFIIFAKSSRCFHEKENFLVDSQKRAFSRKQISSNYAKFVFLRNWERGRAVSFLGIHNSNLVCSVIPKNPLDEYGIPPGYNHATALSYG